MAKQSNLQIIIIGVSAIVAIFAVFLFAFQRNTNSNQQTAPVLVWGTVDQVVMDDLVNLISAANLSWNFDHVTYEYKDPDTFDTVFVEALATGNGPDVIMLPQEELVRHQNKILPLPFESYPRRLFSDTFIQHGEMFVSHEGVIGLPFMIDPMVMYWNRTMFSNAGIAQSPKTWNQVMSTVPQLTQTNSSFEVTKSALAFGEYVNVTHAKEILLMLMFQAGNDIVRRITPTTDEGLPYEVTMTDRGGFSVTPTLAALQFYTQFADPNNKVYSWNRSLPESRDEFITGDLGMYFGYASEAFGIRAQNPNLNFDVSLVPQSNSEQNENVVFGRMLGLAIPKTSQVVPSAFNTISKLSGPESVKLVSEMVGLPSVRRDVIVQNAASSFQDVFNMSALWSRGFLDPDKGQTNTLFKDMIESVTTGRRGVTEAIQRAKQELVLLFN